MTKEEKVLAAQLSAHLVEQAAQIEKLNATVALLVKHDAAVRAEIRELRARRQPDTLERRAAGMTEYQIARKVLIEENGWPANKWVDNTLIRERMALTAKREPEAAPPPSASDEEVAL